MAPSFALLLCPLMTVLAMRSSDVQHDRLVEEEMDEAVGWPFSSAREVVITRQHDSTSGQKSKPGMMWSCSKVCI